MSRRLVRIAPLAGALFFPALAMASNQGGLPGPEAFTLRPPVEQIADNDGQQAYASAKAPQYLADMADEKPNIHGFFSSPFKTSYVTPRGLVVENSGVVWQPVGGLVIPIGDFGPVKNVAVIGGIWNSVNTAQGDTDVGPWNEMDVFVSLAGDIGKFNATLTYGAWNFPNSTVAKPSTEHNIDLKVVFDDTDLIFKGFAFKPYFDLFWAVGGSSTVVLGRSGDTGYIEVGVAPSYTYKDIANYPITFTFPVYASFGPAGYWGADNHDGNVGVFSAAINASMPLSFIPTKYGFWHVDAGFTYYYLINDNLLAAGDILTGNDNRNVYQGSLGVGVNF